MMRKCNIFRFIYKTFFVDNRYSNILLADYSSLMHKKYSIFILFKLKRILVLFKIVFVVVGENIYDVLAFSRTKIYDRSKAVFG